MTEEQHQEALEFFRLRAIREAEEKAESIKRQHAYCLQHFGHYHMNIVPRGEQLYLSSCVCCHQERQPKSEEHLIRYGDGFFGGPRTVHFLTPCSCCPECHGRGFRWIDTPLPPGRFLGDGDPAPEGWVPFTRKKCKCQKRKGNP